MNKLLIAIIVLAVLGAGGWWYYSQDTDTAPLFESMREVPSEILTPSAQEPQSVVIAYTGEGFVPAAVTIKKGTSVTFRNDSATETWPASSMHPTHTGYPVSGGCIGSAFDACRALKPGESWSFTFNAIGTWNYHDHVHARQFGSITVEE